MSIDHKVAGQNIFGLLMSVQQTNSVAGSIFLQFIASREISDIGHMLGYVALGLEGYMDMDNVNVITNVFEQMYGGNLNDLSAAIKKPYSIEQNEDGPLTVNGKQVKVDSRYSINRSQVRAIFEFHRQWLSDYSRGQEPAMYEAIAQEVGCGTETVQAYLTQARAIRYKARGTPAGASGAPQSDQLIDGF